MFLLLFPCLQGNHPKTCRKKRILGRFLETPFCPPIFPLADGLEWIRGQGCLVGGGSDPPRPDPPKCPPPPECQPPHHWHPRWFVHLLCRTLKVAREWVQLCVLSEDHAHVQRIPSALKTPKEKFDSKTQYEKA